MKEGALRVPDSRQQPYEDHAVGQTGRHLVLGYLEPPNVCKLPKLLGFVSWESHLAVQVIHRRLRLPNEASCNESTSLDASSRMGRNIASYKYVALQAHKQHMPGNVVEKYLDCCLRFRAA